MFYNVNKNKLREGLRLGVFCGRNIFENVCCF